MLPFCALTWLASRVKGTKGTAARKGSETASQPGNDKPLPPQETQSQAPTHGTEKVSSATSMPYTLECAIYIMCIHVHIHTCVYLYYSVCVCSYFCKNGSPESAQERIPADCLLLTSSHPDGHCSVETANLDGETSRGHRNMKLAGFLGYMGVSQEEAYMLRTAQNARFFVLNTNP